MWLMNHGTNEYALDQVIFSVLTTALCQLLFATCIMLLTTLTDHSSIIMVSTVASVNEVAMRAAE